MGKHRSFIGAGLLSLIAGAAGACPADQVDIRTGAGPVSFAVEIADTEEERARGLMYRERMAPDAGMLFVYDSARQVAFWMKNTPLPLDIIYINRRGVICSIAADTTPYSTTPIPSNCAAQIVLEVNAGTAAALGLKVGAPVRHPSVAAPVWPCKE